MSSSRKWDKEAYNSATGRYEVVEDYGITIEWEHNSGGYSWDTWALLSKKSGDETLYAAYIDGGCSCVYEFERHPDSYDLAWTPSLKEAASTLSKSIRDSNYYGDSDWTPDKRVSVNSSLSQAVKALR